MTLRRLLLAVLTLLATWLPTAQAGDPTMLVATREDGALVRVRVTGRAATTEVLVPGREGVLLLPTQANGAAVSYVSETEVGRTTRYDVGVVDATTGARRALSRDGRSGHLLVSPDGRFRYVLTANEGALLSLVRTDANGKNRKTLLAGPTGRAARLNEVQLSGSGISPDGGTVYVARTAGDGPSVLFGVDTRTGARREIRHRAPYEVIYNVVASPDGKTLAVSFAADEDFATLRVGLVRLDGGPTTFFDTYGDLHASAFTPDGSGVLLTSQGSVIGTNMSPNIYIGDVTTRAVLPILGTDGLFQAVAVK